MLRDCHARGHEAELFLVEGKSAADAVGAARSRRTQAVFAMQGKIPNPTKHPARKILANAQCRALLDLLRIDLTSFDLPGSDLPRSHLFRAEQIETDNPNLCPDYGRILLLCDNDPDGHHARSLMIAFSSIFLSPLVRAGRIVLLQAPAYRVNTAPAQYLYSQQELTQWQAEVETQVSITHFKGVASLQTEEIWNLLLNPLTRNESPLGQQAADHAHTNPVSPDNNDVLADTLAAAERKPA